MKKRLRKGKKAHLDVFGCDSRLHVLDDNHRSTNAASIRSDVDCVVVIVRVDTDEFGDATVPPKPSEALNEAHRESGDSEDITIDVYDVRIVPVELRAGDQVDVCPFAIHIMY